MFTAVVVATLALCIGATTSVFSIVESALLNGLGYRQIDRLVAVWSDNPQRTTDHYQVSVGDYFDWRARSSLVTSSSPASFPSWNAMYSGPEGWSESTSARFRQISCGRSALRRRSGATSPTPKTGAAPPAP